MRTLKLFIIYTLIGCNMAFALKSPTSLSYKYTIPYAGSATITIANQGPNPVTINNLEFTTNTEISGAPWGTLFGWQSQLTEKPHSDHAHVIHTILEKPAVTIAPKQSASLTFNVGHILGKLHPFKAAMDPVTVKVNDEVIEIENRCTLDACKDPGNGKRILGYFPNWAYWRSPKFTAEKIDYNKLNMVNYAFAIFDQDGKVSLYDQDSDAVNIPIISQKRKQLPYLNASLAFGGWSWFSTPPGWICPKGESPEGPGRCFSKLAHNDEALQTFTKNAVSAMKEVNFNGIDIDWEYPDIKDAPYYIKMLQLLRQELDAAAAKDGTRYYLTVAVGAGIDKIKMLTMTEWQTVAKLVDHIGVMTYDFHGAWDQGQVGSNFMSAMLLDKNNDVTYSNPVLGKYNLTDALNAFLERGVTPDKLIVGVPMYGRMVNIAQAGNSYGLYQSITGTPQGEWDNQSSGHTGMLNYNCIVHAASCGNNYSLPHLNLVDPTINSWGKFSLTPWGYSNNLFVTYDDAKSATYKANWVVQQKFAGVMLWDLTGDFPGNDERSIVGAVQKVFSKN